MKTIILNNMQTLTKGRHLMKLKYLLPVIFILMADFIHATAISEQQASLVAVNFMKSTTGLTSFKAILNYKEAEKDASVNFYVFNFLSYQGFVVVTGDDNIEPVIGYSTESGFDISVSKNIGISAWMNDVRKQIQEALKLNVKADTRIAGLWSAYLSGSQIMSPQSASVSPLLTTTWNQSKIINGTQYYNSLCPFDATANQRCPAGCVATAMAQIMKYWNYPPKGIGSNSYTSGSYGTQSANFGATTYNWSQMPDAPTSTSTHDIDILMYHCGVAVNMNYGPSGSSSTTIGGSPSALSAYVDYFGYSVTRISGVYASNYTSAAWINLLKSELDAKRPMQYRGVDPSNGGHSWVCDGYDANDMLHMNWGWGGSNNGYFSVTSLNPGSYNFSNSQGAIIGIWPGTLSDCDANWSLSGNQTTTYTWQASDYITSSMNITATLPVAYTAANKITLTPGFRATAASKFSAKIQSCMTYKIGDNSSPETAENTGDKNLSVYPNPFSSIINLKYTPVTSGKLKMEIIDIQGKILKSMSQEISENGIEIKIPLNLETLPPGFYFLKVSDGVSESFQKIIKS